MQNSLINPHEYRLLLGEVLNQPPEWVFMHLPELQLSTLQEQKLNALVNRRLNGEPIAKILGYKEFYGRKFYTNSYTLDPRPDSETLIDAVLSNVSKDAHLQIVDFGLGTGCLLFTLLSELPNSTGVGIDYSIDALHVAQKNQDNLHLSERAILVQSNWDDALSGGFDIIVANPPYIAKHEVLDVATGYDPHLALFAGETGLEVYRQLIPQLRKLLNPQGKIFLEIGRGQELCVENIALASGLIKFGIFLDLSGIVRVLCYSANNSQE